MKRTLLFLVALLAVGTTGTGHAAIYAGVESVRRDFAIDPNAAVVIENWFGNIDVVAADGNTLSVVIRKEIRGVDRAAVEEGRNAVKIEISGDNKTRVLRTLFPAQRVQRWEPNVSYTVRVPRNAHIRIRNHATERIRVSGVAGPIGISSNAGPIFLEAVSGSAFVQSSNGNIHYSASATPTGDVQLTTINGYVQVTMPPAANLRWIAQTLKGDFLTNLPLKGGRFTGTSFTGVLNSSRGPTLTTAAMMGNVFFLRHGSDRTAAKSVRLQLAALPRTVPPNAGPAVPREFRRPLVAEAFRFKTPIGDVAIGQIQGNAQIETGAGQVQLGVVNGDCQILSHGGPLDLGDIFGTVSGETKAGDILVRSARRGGSLTTGGGIIRVFYAGGPMTLRSGGGDIFVRSASSAINAETRSGDVTINYEANVKSASVAARTAEGNVVLNVSPSFAADIEAVVTTSDPSAEGIRSEFGLAIHREQVGGRTRIRATGKINGGGEKIELSADEGSIRISAQAVPSVLGPIR
ncbi:MAG TPA: DUF4097 family beta strand repeat-containing protein [Thermoanaerobaculia bacterium]|nr:DUF4097 family beta strand repeat-containing protein [Thermoanaerobaculia bacterium]